MRALQYLSALAVLLGTACSSSDSSAPIQYIQFSYTLTPSDPASYQAVMLLLNPANLACGRANQQIRLQARRGEVAINFALSGAGTAPNQKALTASRSSRGVADVDVSVPQLGADMGSSTAAVFTTSDVNGLFTCTLSLLTNDPFSKFDGEFSCVSSMNQTPSLSLTQGSYHAVLCP